MEPKGVKIKTQLVTTIATFIVILVIINTSLVYTDQQATVLSNEHIIATNIQKRIGNLNNIANSFYFYQQDSQLVDWQSNITTLYGYITVLNATDHNQQPILATLNTDIQKVNNTFNSSVSYIESTPRNETIRVSTEFQAIWDNLSNALQNFSSDSASFSQSLNNQAHAIERSNIVLVAILLLAFAVYLIINYFIMFRHTLRSISDLQNDLKVIATGNFDYSPKTQKKDELGELSKSIDQMAIQLKEFTAKLQTQERLAAIGQTAGMVGHDLRNPLQTIVDEVYLIEQELNSLPNSDGKVSLKESIQNITEQINYMNKIIADLQTFVKPVQSHKENILIETLISKVLENIKIPTNIKTTINLESKSTINTDPELLKRVLINLVTNSIQAMPNGGTLTIAAQTIDKEKIRINVTDTGSGIPEEVKPKIFTPLFTTKVKGQGFGLAICKRIIEAQGGTITFQSETGKGTTFTIEIPSENNTNLTHYE